MTLQAVDALGADSAPTAILDRVSLVLDAFDGPGGGGLGDLLGGLLGGGKK